MLLSSSSGVVQCFNNAVRNDWGRPWTMQAPSSLSGSGFIISLERRLIVTNAHVVSFARTFQVRKDGDFDKYESHILAVSHQVTRRGPLNPSPKRAIEQRRRDA